MEKSKQDKATRSLNVATAVTTSAMSLALFHSLQLPVLGQDPQPVPVQQNRFSDDEAREKFFNMGYNYCDAKVLAKFWGEGTPWDAKARLGHKILTFGFDDGAAHVSRARLKALSKPIHETIWYEDGGYTYEDAEQLAKYWGADLAESKLTMNRLLVMGHDKVLKAALKSAKAGQ